MKILHGYKLAHRILNSPVLAIGVFDGVHIGHRRVIKKMMKSSLLGDKTILTFDPHPETVLRPHKELPRIMSLEHRLRIFDQMGLDAAVVIRFSKYISGMSPEDFISKVIKRGLGAKRVFVGENFYFGKGASADVIKFQQIGKERGVKVDIVNSLKTSGKTVSSTRVRELVSKGKIKEAGKLLGRSVSVLGTVVSGDGVGRTIGTPTANIDPHHEVIPPVGVYAVKVFLKGKYLPGVLNIGYKPTFYGRSPKRKEPVIEAHIIGFKGDIYGKDIEVFFLKKLRREKRFKSHVELKRQIEKDILAAKELMSNSDQGAK